MAQRDLSLMNKIGICDKCKAVNYRSIISKVKKIDQNAQFIVRCQNMCGIGRNKPFAIVNNKPLIGENEEDLVNKIKDMLK